MPTRNANAEWHGNIREGKGHVRFGGGAYEGSYSAASRFADGGGTNPEELIAAAHAACFSMAFSVNLSMAGFTPTTIRTSAEVHIEQVDGAWTITRIDLICGAEVPGIDEAKFQELAQSAKRNCPVSRALKGVAEINLEATLGG